MKYTNIKIKKTLLKCDDPYIKKLDTPIEDVLYGGFIDKIPINCGKCYNCKRNRVNGWSFRLMKELERSQSAHFITLTYSTQYIAYSDMGFPTLKKEHLQRFFKRLRLFVKEDLDVSSLELEYARKKVKLDRTKPLKYYSVGEYGSIRKRPHFHIILFNLHNVDLITRAWSETILNQDKTVNHYDPWGTVHIDKVNNNTIDYTLKYIEKPQTKLFKNFDGIKEFSLMSKNLGDNYITETIEKYHASSNDNHFLTTSRNYKIPIPKYYRDKLYTQEDKVELMSHIKKEMEKEEERQEKLAGENYFIYLRDAQQARSMLNGKQLKSRSVD